VNDNKLSRRIFLISLQFGNGKIDTYAAVEPFHLFRHIDEQAFRYNAGGMRTVINLAMLRDSRQ